MKCNRVVGRQVAGGLGGLARDASVARIPQVLGHFAYQRVELPSVDTFIALDQNHY